MAWLPATHWLLWVKSLNGSSCDFNQQSIFCLDVVTNERHQLLEPAHWHCQGKNEPVVAPTGSLMAYVREVCITLVSLPHLRHEANLSSSIHKRSDVACMRFTATASHLAICWDGEGHARRNAEAAPFCLDVFDTSTHARCFSMPSQARPSCSWSSNSPHLVIATPPEARILDLARLECHPVPDGTKRTAVQWTVNGLPMHTTIMMDARSSPPLAPHHVVLSKFI